MQYRQYEKRKKKRDFLSASKPDPAAQRIWSTGCYVPEGRIVFACLAFLENSENECVVNERGGCGGLPLIFYRLGVVDDGLSADHQLIILNFHHEVGVCTVYFF